MNRTYTIEHGNIRICLTVPNWINKYRATTFSEKEPETLAWIDSFERESVLWDVGANVGLYSIYAAKKRKCSVIAFEPSVFNLEILARNLFLNDVKEWVTIAPIALNDVLGPNFMRLTSTDWGGSCSTFDKNVGWDGQPIRQVFTYKTLGATLDQGVELFGLPPPSYIKMDVDGIEHFILAGGEKLLRNVESVLVEINDEFIDQGEKTARILTDSGLLLSDKRQSKIISNSAFSGTFNQIWVRPH